MSIQINFREVIDSLGVMFSVSKKEEGHRVNGKWVPGMADDEQLTGVILPLSNDDMQYIESGTYTKKEKKLYVVTPIALGSEVEYKGETYTIQAFKDLTEYTDVHIYLMRYRENAKGG